MCKCEDCKYYDALYWYDDETYEYYEYRSSQVFLCEKYDKLVVEGKMEK